MAAGRKGFPWSTSFCSRSARRCWPTGSGYGRGAAKPSRASPAAGTDAMLVDSHCHIDAGEFDRDRDEVIARARAAGVARQVVPAIHAAGWPKLRDICAGTNGLRSEEHTSELQSLMRISYAVFCLEKQKTDRTSQQT